MNENQHLMILPSSIMTGISTAIHGPNASAKACAIPNLGEFFYHKGVK